MRTRFTTHLFALTFLFAGAACDRPGRGVPTTSPVPSTPAAVRTPPALASERFAWGARFLPAEIPRGLANPSPSATSVLFVDFEELRRHPGMEPLLGLGFGAADLAVELAILARDLQCFWRFEVGNSDPRAPPPFSPISIARVANPETVLARLQSRYREGKIRIVVIDGQEWFEDSPTMSFETVMDNRVVRVRTRACVDWIRETLSGSRPSLVDAPGARDILALSPKHAGSIFLTSNRRYSRLSIHDETLLLAGSAVTATEKIGILAFASEEAAVNGILPVTLQLSEEPIATSLNRDRNLLVLRTLLEPDQSDFAPKPREQGLILGVADWIPAPVEGESETTIDCFVPGETSPPDSAPRQRALDLFHSTGLSLPEPTSVRIRIRGASSPEPGMDMAIFEGAGENWPLAFAVGAAGASRFSQSRIGSMPIWLTPEFAVWAIRGKLLLWGRDSETFHLMLRARYGLSPSLLDLPELREAAGACPPDVRSLRLSWGAAGQPRVASLVLECGSGTDRASILAFRTTAEALDVFESEGQAVEGRRLQGRLILSKPR